MPAPGSTAVEAKVLMARRALLIDAAGTRLRVEVGPSPRTTGSSSSSASTRSVGG